jgi:hypothetical protein
MSVIVSILLIAGTAVLLLGLLRLSAALLENLNKRFCFFYVGYGDNQWLTFFM